MQSPPSRRRQKPRALLASGYAMFWFFRTSRRCLPGRFRCSMEHRFLSARALFRLGMDAGEFAKHFYGHKIAFYLFFLVN